LGFEAIQSLTINHLTPRSNSQIQPPIEITMATKKVTLTRNRRTLPPELEGKAGFYLSIFEPWMKARRSADRSWERPPDILHKTIQALRYNDKSFELRT
jgi:hypothetical protein